MTINLTAPAGPAATVKRRRAQRTRRRAPEFVQIGDGIWKRMIGLHARDLSTPPRRITPKSMKRRI